MKGKINIQKGVRLASIGVIFLLSAYILMILGYRLLGDMFQNGFQGILKSGFSSLTNSIYSSSATIDYTLTPDKETLSDHVLVASISSSFLRYVQASTTEDTNSVATKDHLLIYDGDHLTTDEDSTASDEDGDITTVVGTEDVFGNIYDEIYLEGDENIPDSSLAVHTLSNSAKTALEQNQLLINTLKKNLDSSYLIQNFFYADKLSGFDQDVFQPKKLLTKDLTIKKDANNGPQILICHTHAHEAFIDSREGITADSIVGAGEELTRILEEEYGYDVLHYAKQYSYNSSYSLARKDITRILAENPSIQVVIDLHRNGVSKNNKTHSVVEVDGVKMAKVMYFNGVSHNTDGPRANLNNPNLQSNIAFSLQMKLYAMETFPELTYKNAIKSYRFNMDLAARYTLIELGDNNNTVAEVKAALKPIAETLDYVLTTKPQ